MQRTLQMAFIAAAFLAPAAAFAHGEEIVFTLGAQLLAIVGCVVASVLFIRPRGYRALAIIGGLLGVVLSWLVTSDWPYLANRVAITALGIGLPILGTLVVLVFVKVHRHDH
jgi:hypothetical protein